MPTCGHCGKPVAASDITCPHCDVLLAAYTSPIGSGAVGTYEPPAEPPTTVIPDIEMEVKPPSETDIVTDPAQIAEEPISTAPRPLFDTYLTVDEIARAAEGDHIDDVVIVPEGKIATKKVEFEVPDYARPPKDAAPIPTIDEDDVSVPLITHDQTPAPSAPAPAPVDPPAQTAPIETQEDEEDESDSDPDPEPVAESWLHMESAPLPQPRPGAQTKQPATPAPQSDPVSEPVGETDAYLRRLHAQTGYTASEATISQPVEERRISPRERNRNRRSALSVNPEQQSTASEQSTQLGCSVLYALVVGILWISVFVSVANGSFSPFLIFVTFAVTWGFGPVRKFINQMNQ